jgi:hypothetical protein
LYQPILGKTKIIKKLNLFSQIEKLRERERERGGGGERVVSVFFLRIVMSHYYRHSSLEWPGQSHN